jgi:hypothetical protein
LIINLLESAFADSMPLWREIRLVRESIADGRHDDSLPDVYPAALSMDLGGDWNVERNRSIYRGPRCSRWKGRPVALSGWAQWVSGRRPSAVEAHVRICSGRAHEVSGAYRRPVLRCSAILLGQGRGRIADGSDRRHVGTTCGAVLRCVQRRQRWSRWRRLHRRLQVAAPCRQQAR